MSSTGFSNNSPSDHTNSVDESDYSSGHIDSPPAKGVKLWEEEIKILEADLDQWKHADKNKRTTIMTHIRSKIKNLEANKTLKMHEWVRKKGMDHKDCDHASMEEGYQYVMKMLTEEEKEEAEELAGEWNKQHPPQEVQAKFRNAKKGQQYAKEFAKEMWKCCEARVVVMVAWKDNDGEVMVTGQVWFPFHDFNDKFGDSKCFPDLEHCQQKFAQYSRMIFTTNNDEKGSSSNDESRHMVRKSKARLQILLPTHQNGTPYISNILNLHVPEMKNIIRAFMTFHYSLWAMINFVCGKPTATVPWGAVAGNTSTYIAPKYLPHGVTFKEPTCLTWDKLTQILELWRDCNEHNPDDTFHFSWWQDADGSLQMPVTDTQKVASNGGHQKRHRKPGQRPLIPAMIKRTTEVKGHQHQTGRFNNAGQSSLWLIGIQGHRQ
ncbi:hypothetical protein J3A83DRAFT_4190761 [Scleroderma citrinum]